MALLTGWLCCLPQPKRDLSHSASEKDLAALLPEDVQVKAKLSALVRDLMADEEMQSNLQKERTRIREKIVEIPLVNDQVRCRPGSHHYVELGQHHHDATIMPEAA
jgi:hypothetical protein